MHSQTTQRNIHHVRMNTLLKVSTQRLGRKKENAVFSGISMHTWWRKIPSRTSGILINLPHIVSNAIFHHERLVEHNSSLI
jgi:hypothetical protein